MELHTILSLLSEQPKREIDANILYFEQIPNWIDEQGFPQTVIALVLQDAGKIVMVGVCVLVRKDQALIAAQLDIIELAFKGGSMVKILLTVPSSDASYPWPQIHAVAAVE